MSAAVCVAVPFYANLSYLEAALESLVAQTDTGWTAIVVDDASPEDGAQEAVMALDDPRIQYVRNEANLGIAGNFDRCLDLARAFAAFVTILHADDVLDPGFVGAVRSAHEAFPTATCVATRVTVIDADGRPSRTLADSVKGVLWPRRLPCVLMGDSGLARVLHGLFLYCPAVSYHVDHLPALRFDARWKQVMDLDLFARVLLAGGSIALVPERVYRYRRHDAGATRQNTRSGLRAREEALVIVEIVAVARRLRWRRSVRAGRLRPTVRLNGWLTRR